MEGPEPVTGAPPLGPERYTRFPIPLVGTAALLALLIVLTPVLITSGGAGGTLLTQAELIVDHAPGSPNTTFMVRAAGTVRYAEISFGLNSSYDPSASPTSITWSWTNSSDSLGVVVSTANVSVAVNVTVYYQPRSGPMVLYYGVVGVQFSGSTLRLSAISSGITTPSSPIPITSSLLPLSISLEYLGSVSGVPPP